MNYKDIAKQTETTYLDYKKIKETFKEIGYFLEDYVVYGGEVTRNLIFSNRVDVSASIIALDREVTFREGATFETSTPNSLYYLDFSEGDFTWGKNHPNESYLTIAEVTTNSNGLVEEILDTRGDVGGTRFRGVVFGEGSEMETSENVQKKINTLKEEIDLKLDQAAKLVHSGMSQSEIQDIINNYTSVEFVDGVYNIDASIGLGLNIPSNRKITFRPNAVLKTIPNDLGYYIVLNINSSENVEIINPNIIGDRDQHLGTTGERGTGIEIRHCTNVQIRSAKISDCWGDGIYINGENENILIDNAYINNCRRNGISLITGKNVKISNTRITNIAGKDPQAGVDIEPNLETDILEGIILENLYTENCFNEGVTVNTTNINNHPNKNVDIKLINHHDIGSRHAFKVLRCVNVDGIIENQRPVYKENPGTSILFRDCDVSGVLNRVIQPTVINSGIHAIKVTKETNDTFSEKIGNVEIIEPTVIDNRNPPLITHPFYFRDMNLGSLVENVNLLNPLKIIGNRTVFFYGSGMFKDLYNQYVYKNDYSTEVIARDRLYVTYDNELFTTKKTYTFKNQIPVGGPEITFNVTNPIGLRIKPYTGEKISVISEEVDKYIESEQVGASITLKKINDTTWIPTKIVGTWTVEP